MTIQIKHQKDNKLKKNFTTELKMIPYSKAYSIIVPRPFFPEKII